MDVTLLGTGAAMPTGDRMQAGYLLEGEPGALLVDCGSGVLHRLSNTETGYAGIDAVLLTHHHLDHVADLLPLLKARWLAGAPPIEVFGPAGTEQLLDNVLETYPYLATNVEAIATDIDSEVEGVAGWSIKAFETRHSMTCFAYRFSGPNGDLTLSGDSEADEALIDFADGSAVLIHDCSFPDDVDVSNHPTPEALGHALAGSSIDRVILTHLYPHTTGRHREMRQSIRAAYDGDVRFGEDLARISV